MFATKIKTKLLFASCQINIEQDELSIMPECLKYFIQLTEYWHNKGAYLR